MWTKTVFAPIFPSQKDIGPFIQVAREDLLFARIQKATDDPIKDEKCSLLEEAKAGTLFAIPSRCSLNTELARAQEFSRHAKSIWQDNIQDTKNAPSHTENILPGLS